MQDRSQFRTKSIGVRVSEADFARLETLAEATGKPLGEWCREVLLKVADHPTGTPVEQALLAEVIGLRTIVGNLVYAFTSDGKVTREQMAGIVERADSTKIKRAVEFPDSSSKRQGTTGGRRPGMNQTGVKKYPHRNPFLPGACSSSHCSSQRSFSLWLSSRSGLRSSATTCSLTYSRRVAVPANTACWLPTTRRTDSFL